MSDPTHDQVGYRRPPRHHQFQPGKSGNPSGRPKDRRSLKADLREELSELISITEGNTTVEVTRQRAIIRTIVRMAIAGDPRAIAMIIGSATRALVDDDDDSTEAPEDEAIMTAMGTGSSQNPKETPVGPAAPKKKEAR